MKKAIIAASYGSAYPSTLTNAIEPVEATFAGAFPDYAVRRAFTGRMTRQALAQKGTPVDSVEEALERLAAEGFDEAAIQPTHIISGSEYDSIRDAAAKFADRFAKIRVGAPLLHDRSDIETICRFLRGKLGGEDSLTVLMGHGSEHHANRLYADFADICRKLRFDDMFIATLESTPSLDDLLPLLKASGRSKITLAPLLFAAGGHACRDMAGDEPHSWKSRLEAEGFTVNAVVKGLGEYSEIRALYVSHLKAAIAE
ncbi:MAG: sirohydrochlorin cobaltochelatase [Clostridia bacterium]|nr:sirohydrochlorin cobaltochelatase [Clostridia bacterium]